MNEHKVFGKLGKQTLLADLLEKSAMLQNDMTQAGIAVQVSMDDYHASKQKHVLLKHVRENAIAAAYASGEITGKNATERTAVEIEMFPEDDVIAAEREAEHDRHLLTIDENNLSGLREQRRLLELRLKALELMIALDKTPDDHG